MKIKILKFLTSVTLAGASAVVTAFVYNHYNQKRNEAIFFYGAQPICNYHRCTTIYTSSENPDDNCSVCKTHIIIGWLNEAKKSLDICIYMLNQELLLSAIIKAHKRGVRVRLIMDDTTVQTWELGTIGIVQKIKTNKYNKNLMHHKFVIIDDKQLIMGSLNWTRMAVRNNWENIIISNERDLVEPFKEEFKMLWKVFD